MEQLQSVNKMAKFNWENEMTNEKLSCLYDVETTTYIWTYKYVWFWSLHYLFESGIIPLCYCVLPR